MFCNQAFTQADWTLPAFSSMLTSLHVSRHGVSDPGGPNEFSLRNEVITLPELMLKQGYRTFAHSGHIRFSPAYGHAKGFERFIFKPFSGENSFMAIQDVIFHLDAHKEEYNFIIMHVFDTHPPFKPSSYLKDNLMKPFQDGRVCQKANGNKDDSHQDNMIEDEFKAKLKEFDVSIANLFSYLEKNNMIDDTLIIFTTDHGISDREQEKPRLFNERIHVPLLVRGPNIAKGEENSLIESSVDLMPSILHSANIDIPDHIDGRVWPFLGGTKRDKVFSESLFGNKYSAVIKDNKNCYHLNYPYDADNKSIDFKKRKPIVSYKRENFLDLEENVNIDEKQAQKIYDEVEKMYSSAKKFY
jgi:arylsulfatase A-like enzyme